ncbi:MAG: hypothetical protein QG671_3500 [Actinomycetota bacterium]|nr:hypothetical protein [Actinomycetota bacterium]
MDPMLAGLLVALGFGLGAGGLMAALRWGLGVRLGDVPFYTTISATTATATAASDATWTVTPFPPEPAAPAAEMQSATQPNKHFLTRQLPDWVQYRDIPVAEPTPAASEPEPTPVPEVVEETAEQVEVVVEETAEQTDIVIDDVAVEPVAEVVPEPVIEPEPAAPPTVEVVAESIAVEPVVEAPPVKPKVWNHHYRLSSREEVGGRPRRIYVDAEDSGNRLILED